MPWDWVDMGIDGVLPRIDRVDDNTPSVSICEIITEIECLGLSAMMSPRKHKSIYREWQKMMAALGISLANPQVTVSITPWKWLETGIEQGLAAANLINRSSPVTEICDTIAELEALGMCAMTSGISHQNLVKEETRLRKLSGKSCG